MMNNYDLGSLASLSFIGYIYIRVRDSHPEYSLFLTLITLVLVLATLYFINYFANRVKKNRLEYPIFMIVFSALVLVVSIFAGFSSSVIVFSMIVMITYLVQIYLAMDRNSEIEDEIDLSSPEEEEPLKHVEKNDDTQKGNIIINNTTTNNIIIKEDNSTTNIQHNVYNHMDLTPLISLQDSVQKLQAASHNETLTPALIANAEEKQDYVVQNLKEQYELKLEVLNQQLTAARGNEAKLQEANAAISKLQQEYEESKAKLEETREEIDKIKQFYEEEIDKLEKESSEKIKKVEGEKKKVKEECNRFKKKAAGLEKDNREKEKRIGEEQQKNEALSKENASLRKQLRETQDKYIQEIETLRKKGGRIVRNEEIRDAVSRALRDAKKEINIASPWISDWVLDKNYEKMVLGPLRELLKKNVRVKIFYGIGRLDGSDNRASTTEKNAEALRREFSKYPNFSIERGDSHAKLLLCDDKYYILTSFNILSFIGTYNGDNRDEIGEIIESSDNIKQYRDYYFNFTH